MELWLFLKRRELPSRAERTARALAKSWSSLGQASTLSRKARPPRPTKNPAVAGLSVVGEKGLEPLTPCL